MNFKSILTDAPLISAIVLITVFSAFYHITMVSSDGTFRSDYCVLMAVLTLLTLCGALVLSVMFRKSSVCMFTAAVYVLCFICYLHFAIAGATDVYGDTALEKIMLALTFPAEAIASLGGKAVVLTVTGIAALASVACCVINSVKNGKNKT